MADFLKKEKQQKKPVHPCQMTQFSVKSLVDLPFQL